MDINFHNFFKIRFLIRRKAIRTAAINRWPGNDIPNFKKNKVAVDELNDLVNDLKEDCSFPPLNFGKEGIKQHILEVLNERRRHKRKGHDYSQVSFMSITLIFIYWPIISYSCMQTLIWKELEPTEKILFALQQRTSKWTYCY